MKQSINVYYRQWRDYFDYLKIDLILPEICVNDYFISDELSLADLWTDRLGVDGKKPLLWRFRVCAESCFRIENEKDIFELRLTILGFGISVIRQRGC